MPILYMWVSKISDHWCAFGTMSNFEKRNLRSGHLLRPGHVTFAWSRDIGSSFVYKGVNLLAEQLWQIWRSYAPPFFRYLRKTLRGVEINPPPAGARVKVFKALNDPDVPTAIRAMFTLRADMSVKQTRVSERDDLHLSRCRLSASQRAFSFRAASTWNGLPPRGPPPMLKLQVPLKNMFTAVSFSLW